MPNIIAGLKDIDRERLLKKAQRNLFWLGTEVLEFDLLTEDFHKPMMVEMDNERMEYRRRCRLGKRIIHTGDLWARDYYKTTVGQVQVVQDYLIEPRTTISWWHAVEEMAQEAASAVGKMFMTNDTLRSLRPDIMPAKQAKKWVTTKGFRFKACHDKAPSMRAMGAGSEATGGHSMIGVLDDIIGLNTIEDSAMPRVRRWFGLTARNVIRTDVGWFRLKGTRWDHDDIYSDFLKDQRMWQFRLRAAYETDGVPDWSGEPVLYSRDVLEAKRTSMSRYEWSCQMMNDPLPDEARMWPMELEDDLWISKADAFKGPGRVFILSDPAPANVGGARGEGEKIRADGSKDDWAICAVRIRVEKGIQQGILLNLRSSKGWSKSVGLDQCCKMMSRYGTNLLFNEAYGGLLADYTEDARRAAQRNGVPLYLEKDYKLPQFVNSYASGAKNLRFESLCDWARTGRLKICQDEIPADELEKLFEQTRHWRALAKGRNSLRFDDSADVVSRMTDAALQEFAPQIEVVRADEDDWGDDDGYVPRSRYCAV